ncbi:MAG: biotin--[acetyl-CoA-carboxylase] ligase [Chthoniobacterales bacterium]
MSEFLDRDQIAAGCTGRIGSRIVVFRETESTNDIALRAAEGGEPEGFVVFAESQSRGRGQFGRHWSSATGIGLWFSVLLRPRWEPALLAQVTPIVAVAVARALAADTGLTIRIKPPNDILCGGRKMVGILSEARTGADIFVVSGIGINVNHARTDFPLELQTNATSIAIETGHDWQREPLAAAVLRELEIAYDAVHPPGPALLGEYAALSHGPVYDSLAP